VIFPFAGCEISQVVGLNRGVILQSKTTGMRVKAKLLLWLNLGKRNGGFPVYGNIFLGTFLELLTLALNFRSSREMWEINVKFMQPGAVYNRISCL